MNTTLLQEAKEFITSCYQELNRPQIEIDERIDSITKQIESTGTYEHTSFEIDYGAKVSWRNSNRCIGRLFWDQMHTFDKRKLKTEEEIFEAILAHMAYATNGGRIRPSISVFAPQKENERISIWNHQLIRYAGYTTPDGVLGDPASISFTEKCMELGWEPKYGKFDILPIVIQINDHAPKLFELPKDAALEVEIRHPEYKWFEGLHLKWHGVPFISDMALEIGGIRYSAAPFNGWYMGTEIGARNLADEDRYNMLPQIASLMGLDTKSSITLWKDKALVELNIAVLHSFREDGVSIVDHHTAAQQFKKFEEKEIESGRPVTGNWAWLIPPVSPATTHIFHKPYKNDIVKPNYFYQPRPY
ncbi:nitric oxide synthase [Fictibacillus arsenicus]|uniref:Nitric oxide synthase oxygenase n=1 Tax=Fictibacillus arsenicus TaxID=255247 RepID=A0A1B1Z2M6_9BACL|nr:nitric oxide synthase oxygenase [Fictibacillus arsenicus]ANX11712.1 nitric oxide synthase [Fictibacillus arsenicus]